MKRHKKQFLGLEPEYTDFEKAGIIILPVPYEGGVSYGRGTKKAPEAVLDASKQVELYDERLDMEPYKLGISTLSPLKLSKNPEKMIRTVQDAVRNLIQEDKFTILIGGDHSVTTGYARAVREKYGTFSIIQLDAHADLRTSYEGSRWSHACIMARIRELTPHTLQIGIRSLSAEEAKLSKDENLSLYTMHDFRKNPGFFYKSLKKCPDPVFLTLDVDVFDWSVIQSTGTPEPGGLLWDEGLDLLETIFREKEIIGFDVVELSHRKGDINSPFAVARLIYKMIGMKFFQ